MAGDTHDFEYYREVDDGRAGRRMHHFVNGGGGAYLSIGTPLDWPVRPAVADWAFYPSTAALRAKLDAETPPWKRLLWWWVSPGGLAVLARDAVGGLRLQSGPILSELRRGPHRGVGRPRARRDAWVHGRLRWRELQLGGQLMREGPARDDPVALVLPLPPPPAR